MWPAGPTSEYIKLFWYVSFQQSFKTHGLDDRAILVLEARSLLYVQYLFQGPFKWASRIYSCSISVEMCTNLTIVNNKYVNIWKICLYKSQFILLNTYIYLVSIKSINSIQVHCTSHTSRIPLYHHLPITRVCVHVKIGFEISCQGKCPRICPT